jgi:putative NADPH-quinone reductase
MDRTKIESLLDPTSHVPCDTDKKSALIEAKAPDVTPVQQKIVWRNVIIFLYTHFAALYGLYLSIFKAKGITVLCGEY